MCRAPATHLMGVELAGVDVLDKARLTIARPLCPAHAAELPGFGVLEVIAAHSWAELGWAYMRNGWGTPDATGSRLYGLPIDESEFAGLFEPAAARGK